MALIAILIGVNFIACSDDEEADTPIKNDDGIVTNQKRLMQIKMVDDYETITWDFTYDSKGRLISINHAERYDGKTDIDITNITWGENIIKEVYDNGDYFTYSLNDGLVRSCSEPKDRDYSFAYNSSKQLTTYQANNRYESSTKTLNLTWDNGKITKMDYNNEEVTEITYGNQTCKGYFPLMVLMVEDDFQLLLAHPELIGMRTTQLPIQTYSKDGYYETTSKLTYKLDKDGYLESCTENSTETYTADDPTPATYVNTTYTYTTNYTFKWE